MSRHIHKSERVEVVIHDFPMVVEQFDTTLPQFLISLGLLMNQGR